MRILPALTSLLVAFPLGIASAQTYEDETPSARDPHYRAHTGFFIRANPGLGGQGLRASEDGTTATIRGGAALFSVAVGGSVASRLALHADYSLISMFAPSVAIDGDSLGSDYDAEVNTHTFGGGLSYYAMSNMYIDVSAGVAWQVISDPYNGVTDGIGPGFATSVKLGKEWFVGGQFGLGFAGQATFTRVLNDFDVPWNGTMLGVVGSATFN